MMDVQVPGGARPRSSSLPHVQRGRPPEVRRCTSTGSSVPPERQLTAMLVAVCVAFVCLRLPYTIAYYIYTYRAQLWTTHQLTPDFDFQTFVAWRFTDVIATSNYVVNFFLYSLCGSYFRQQVRNAFRCPWRRSPGRKVGHWPRRWLPIVRGSVTTNGSGSTRTRGGSCSSNGTVRMSLTLTSDLKLIRMYSESEAAPMRKNSVP
jgi:hypothetical protein